MPVLCDNTGRADTSLLITPKKGVWNLPVVNELPCCRSVEFLFWHGTIFALLPGRLSRPDVHDSDLCSSAVAFIPVERATPHMVVAATAEGGPALSEYQFVDTASSRAQPDGAVGRGRPTRRGADGPGDRHVGAALAGSGHAAGDGRHCHRHGRGRQRQHGGT